MNCEETAAPTPDEIDADKPNVGHSLAQPLPCSPFPLSFLCRCPWLCHKTHHIWHHALRQRSQRAASGSRICPFIPVMGANNLSLNRNLSAQLATMVEPAGRPLFSHGVLLGSFRCGQRNFSCSPPYSKSPLFLLLMLNFLPWRVFLYCSVRMTLFRLRPMLHVSTQPATSSTAQHSTAKWLTIDQIANKVGWPGWDLTGRQCVSFSPFL